MLARPVSTASAGSAGVEETLPTNRVSSERQRTMSVKVPPISTPIRTPGDAVVIGGLSCQRRSRAALWLLRLGRRSEEHTSELQSLMRISYAVFCLKKKNQNKVSQ